MREVRYTPSQQLALCRFALAHIKGKGPIYLGDQFTDRTVHALKAKDSRAKGKENPKLERTYDLISLWDPIRITGRRWIATVSAMHETPATEFVSTTFRLDMRKTRASWSLRQADSHPLPHDASMAVFRAVLQGRGYKKEKIFVTATPEVKDNLRKLALNVQNDSFKDEKDYQDTGFYSADVDVIAWISRTSVRVTVGTLYRPAGNDVSYSYGAPFSARLRHGRWVVKQEGMWQGE